MASVLIVDREVVKMRVIYNAEEEVLDEDGADCWVLVDVQRHHWHLRPLPFSENEQHRGDGAEGEHRYHHGRTPFKICAASRDGDEQEHNCGGTGDDARVIDHSNLMLQLSVDFTWRQCERNDGSRKNG